MNLDYIDRCKIKQDADKLAVAFAEIIKQAKSIYSPNILFSALFAMDKVERLIIEIILDQIDIYEDDIQNAVNKFINTKIKARSEAIKPFLEKTDE